MASTGLTPTAIAGNALQIIGAWPTSQSSPDARELQRAIDALDGVIDELAGTINLPWLEREVWIRLEHRKTEYPLESYLVEDGFGQGAEFWRHAKLWSGVAFTTLGAAITDPLDSIYLGAQFRPHDRGPIERLWREDFQRLPGHQTGTPQGVFIDRKLNPVMHVWPIPRALAAEAEIPPAPIYTEWSVQLILQAMPPETDQGIRLTAAWRRYLELATAYEISGGRVRRLPEGLRFTLKADAVVALTALEAINTRNHQQPIIGAAWGEGHGCAMPMISERAFYGEDER